MPENAPKRRILAEDLYSFSWISDPQISPDANTVAFVKTHIEDEQYRQSIWLASVGGKTPERFTYGPKSDKSPRWSPDGSRLAFLSDRSGSTQIWLIDSDGGEARQLTHAKSGISDLCWSPDSKKLAFVLRWSLEDDRDEQQPPSDVRVITRIKYKADGRGFWDGRWAHVHTVDVDTTEIVRLTSGDFDHTNPAWSPDGSQIAFCANRTGDADYTNVTDIWLVSSEGGTPHMLTKSIGPCSEPAFSACGSKIAYFGHDNSYMGATLTSLYIISTAGGNPQKITHDITVGASIASDMRYGDFPARPFWSADGTRIRFMMSHNGTTGIADIALESGEVSLPAKKERSVIGMSWAAQSDVCACVITDHLNPCDLWLIKGKSETRLTRLNDDLLSHLVLSEPERLTYNAEDGLSIDGWIMKPIGFAADKKHPLVLQIHGGPHGAYGAAFYLEFQLLAAQGYGVLFTNPRGSVGYGQKFLAATKEDWGGGDYRDIMAGVEHALQLEWVDSENLGITGGSYGGYMTNWAIGQTQIFKAAVSCRSTCNRYSQFGNSDIGYHNAAFEFPGTPWDHPEFYLAHSPITHAKNVNTPLLLIHSENDYRCPIGQAEEFFVALKYERKTVEMVRFPDEGHELSRSGKPAHRVDRLRRIVGWFEKYLDRA